MKKANLDKLIERAIKFDMKMIDRFIEEEINPLEITDNPEDLIKKPFEQWTSEDLNLLGMIYGTGDDTVLARFIFDKTYEKVQSMEQEEINA